MKKIGSILCAILCFLSLSSVFAGCTKTDENTLTIWTNSPFEADYKTQLANDPDYGQALATKYIVEEFEKAFPGKKLDLKNKGWSDVLNSNIIGGASSGLLPDLLCGETAVQSFADEDFGLLDEIQLPQSVIDNLYESTLYNAKLNGKIYGIPMVTGNLGLVYNETMLKNAGVVDESGNVAVPKTFAELEEASRKVKEKYSDAGGGGMLISVTNDYGGAFRNLYFQRAFGGDIAKDGKLTIATEENKNAFEYLRRLKQYAPANMDYDEQTKIFSALQNGQAAFAVEYPTFLLSMPNANLKTARLPKVNEEDAGTNVLCGNLLFSIPKQAKNKELAQQFLEFMLRDDIQLELYKQTWHLPCTKTAIAKAIANTEQDEKIARANEYMMPYIESMMEDSYPGGLPGFLSDFLKDVWGYWTDFLKDAVKTDLPFLGTGALLPSVENKMKAKITKIF